MCNGECVDSEINCKPLTDCPVDSPFLCYNNKCSKNETQCPYISCGDGHSLCQDNICKEICNI